MKTNKEIRIENWRGHGELVIPKGQPVTPTSHNQYFVESFGNLFDKRSIQYHDATHYGIRVDAMDVEDTSDDRSEPTHANQLWHARKLAREQGTEALRNPHALIGMDCGCGTCFCCAAYQVVTEIEREENRTRNAHTNDAEVQ